MSRIELGEGVPEFQGDTAAAPPSGSTSSRSSSSSSSGTIRVPPTPELQSFSWSITMSAVANDIGAISTPLLPWPFRIVGFTIELSTLAPTANAQKSLQLFSSSQEYNGTLSSIPETPLLPYATGWANTNTAFGVRLRALLNNATTAQVSYQAFANSFLGLTVGDPSRRVVIAIRNNDAVQTTWHGTITLEQLYLGTAQVSSRPSATPIPRTPTRPATPSGPAAPAPACDPMPYGTVTYWQNQITTISRLPGNAPGRAARLAEAQRALMCLTSSPRGQGNISKPMRGSVSTADQAQAIAQRLRAEGNLEDAAIFADMARRMKDGRALTQTQRDFLTRQDVYTPTPRSVRGSAPSQTSTQAFQQLKGTLSDLG